MRGDERVRFCEQCNLHVYNISAMTREAATELIAQHDGRLCVRMYRRDDGTVMTNDCGGGIRKAAKRAAHFAGATASFVLCSAMAPFLIATPPALPSSGAERSIRSFMARLESWIDRLAPIRMGAAPPTLMGDIAGPAAMGGCPPATRPATQPSTQPMEIQMGKIAAPTTDTCSTNDSKHE